MAAVGGGIGMAGCGALMDCGGAASGGGVNEGDGTAERGALMDAGGEAEGEAEGEARTASTSTFTA